MYAVSQVLLPAVFVMLTGAVGAREAAAQGTGTQLPAGKSARPQGAIAKKLVGVWRLVEMDEKGKPDPTRGEHPTGLIFYSENGLMSAQIQPDRQRPAWPNTTLPTPEQARDAAIGYAAYFGTYSVDERTSTVTHHREGALNLDVVDYVRRVEFIGDDRLILFPAERSGRRLVWDRVK